MPAVYNVLCFIPSEKSRQRRSRHVAVLTYSSVRSARPSSCGLSFERPQDRTGRAFLNTPLCFAYGFFVPTYGSTTEIWQLFNSPWNGKLLMMKRSVCWAELETIFLPEDWLIDDLANRIGGSESRGNSQTSTTCEHGQKAGGLVLFPFQLAANQSWAPNPTSSAEGLRRVYVPSA
jgi:hypothetical protein